MRKTMVVVVGIVVATLASARLEPVQAGESVSGSELLARAEALRDELQAIHAEAVGCPGGECGEAGLILDRFDAAGAELGTIHADRNTLGACSCATLDSLIGQLDEMEDQVSVVVGEWQDE